MLTSASLHSPPHKKAVVGFDGYIDSVVQVLYSEDHRFETLTQFGDYVRGRANRSGSVMVRQITEKLGGNMPIFSNALSKLGIDVTCIGAMGYPEVLPIFKSLESKCTLKSVSNPGLCQALEFNDGKLMLANNDEIDSLSYDLLVERAGKDFLLNTFQQSDMIVLLNWSEIKQSISIWHGIQDDYLSFLADKGYKRIFIDLSDCSLRPVEDVQDVIQLIQALSSSFDVSLSLNQNEADVVAKAAGLPPMSTEEIASSLHQLLGCSRLIAHLVDRCYCAHEGKIYMQYNRFIEHPVLSTGGGDNFNAGFVFGLLCEKNCDDCITLANSVASFYVAHGYSPSFDELCTWIDES